MIPSSDWLGSIIQRFEEGWDPDFKPDFSGFLSDLDPNQRQQTLRQLIHSHMELRAQKGLATNLADYLAQYPELKDRREDLLYLLQAECKIWRNLGKDSPRTELMHKYPGLASLIDTALEESIHFNGESSKPDHLPVLVTNNSSQVNDPPPAQIGHFRILQVLGKGNFGRVYLAEDLELGVKVALKVPLPERIASSKDLDNYRKEARVVAHLESIDGIVPIKGVGQDATHPFFVVSQYIEGETLEDSLKKAKPGYLLSTTWVSQICRSLHKAHARGIYHRDLKPANILIDRKNKPWIMDFGLALREEEIGTVKHQGGTPYYMSPEQVKNRGHMVDGRSDVFSLGVIFYELLRGKRPFEATTRDKLFEQILHREPLPLSTHDEDMPRELERICIKALSKGQRDRYSTARDMAEDLEAWLATQTSIFPSESPTSSSSGRETVLRNPGDSETRKSSGVSSEKSPEREQVVPKGLRCFDENDAGFFLDLLPGARGRDGLPESIRFWKTRVESSPGGFSIGLIFGPSGCGKTSLVRAGLIPHLDTTRITPLYLEAAVGQTESRLANGLKRICDNENQGLSLPEQMLAIRQGKAGASGGKRILIILDQFEQWLHERQGDFEGDLTDGLFQCDGQRIQCILMVRDDFAMPIKRFMRHLEIDIMPDQNEQVVDLFDKMHAHKVLLALGRGYGRIAPFPIEPTPEQNQFLNSAIDGLSQEERVISVRVSMFAQMMKSRDWTPSSLQDAGGVQGLGTRFLEETFGTKPGKGHRASVKYFAHQKGVKGVLKVLLPEVGTDIKGQMRSPRELQQAAGYEDQPKEFAELVTILDREIRLITPIDPEGQSPDSGDQKQSGQYYQLAHDYLVPSIREWLRRKQKETVKGRAEILLEERAALWRDKKQNRQLPSLLEYLRIAWYTKPFERTQTQKEMVKQAGWFHGLRACLLITIIFFLSLITWEGYGRLEGRRLRDRLLESTTADLPGIVNELGPYRSWVDPLLKAAYTQAETDKEPRKQLRASLGLMPNDATQVEYLFGQLLRSEPPEFVVIRQELSRHKADISPKLWSILEDSKEPMDQRFHAACALGAYAPEDPRWEKTSTEVAAMLAMQNPFVIGAWTDALKGVATPLLAPLGQILVDETRGLAERGLIATIYDKLAKEQTHGYARLEKMLEEKNPADGNEETKIAWAKKQASLGLALLRMGKGERVWPLLRHSPDPTVRSFLIDRIGPWGIEAKTLLGRLDGEPDVSIRRALLWSLGEYGLDRLSLSERQNQIPRLLDWYREDPDPGIHGATEWLLRQWKAQDAIGSVDKPLATGKVEGKRQWFLNREGHTMVIIPKAEPFTTGDEREGRKRVQINRKFSIATKEVTVEQFLRFRKERIYGEIYAPTKDCPINNVSWYDTAAYCNWLSEKEGMPKEQWCYLPNKDGKYEEGMEFAPNYLQRSGYRLPTEAEWEFACRAGAVTNYSFGAPEELLGKYAWYDSNSLSRSHPVSGLKSNDFGLFDMHGNYWEWSLDFYERNQDETYDIKIINDIEKPTKIDPKSCSVLHGGSFGSQAWYAQSAYRKLSAFPASSDTACGFRVARTITP